MLRWCGALASRAPAGEASASAMRTASGPLRIAGERAAMSLSLMRFDLVQARRKRIELRPQLRVFVLQCGVVGLDLLVEALNRGNRHAALVNGRDVLVVLAVAECG